MISRSRMQLIICAIVAFCCCQFSVAQSPVGKPSTTSTSTDKPEYPPLDSITKGYTEVKPKKGKTSFYKLWYRAKDSQLLAALPRDFARQEHFIALTVSKGERFAGLQVNDFLVQWRQYNKRLALISPNFKIKSDGDQESKDSVKRLFTDSVLLDVPILSMVPRSGPVIDLDDLLVKHATVFFGSSARTSRPQLAKIVDHKAFQNNIEVEVEIPSMTGKFISLHYSISLLKPDPSYHPRPADERIGYFTTSYDDYGKYQTDDNRVRYINRWHLEKRDPKLKLSPPKKPITFYLEHTTPVRYRRWVREGVHYWNKAFEKIGIVNAIQVLQQDAQTGDYMDLDPENVEYNFIRWLNNNISTAIGPSRVNPRTGQILDADIILTDGWIRNFERQFSQIMPKIMTEGMTPETLSWLAKHPNWDPRLRLADPSQRLYMQRDIELRAQQPYADHEIARAKTKILGDDPFDGLYGRTSQVNGYCLAADGRAFDVTLMRMFVRMLDDSDAPKVEEKDKDKENEKEDKDNQDEDQKDEQTDEDKQEDEQKDDKKKEETKEQKKEEKKEDEQLLDGMPESFIGPLLADLVAHEVGHTLGLRHNFKASSVYSLAKLNSKEIKGKKPFAGSVMDYLPVNFNMETGEIQGDYAMIGVGPYDYWAIEYGYTFEKDLKKILKRVAEPALAFATDEDTLGPDPLARRYDFSMDPMDYANNQVRLAKHHRQRILNEFVKDGDSWEKARRGYELTLSLQLRSTSMMANWIGGTFVHRDKKGDPKSRPPVEVVPAEKQRAALKFVVENTLRDEAFGLTPELLVYMSTTFWSDKRSFGSGSEASWPVHDRIMAIQASALTQLMNPTTLRRVYDNEFRVAADKDAFTLHELMNFITDNVWSELSETPKGDYSVRKPAISSLRRNLQTEHLQRLMDLAAGSKSSTAAMKPIANLAAATLKKLKTKVAEAEANSENLDPYTKAHLQDAQSRIEKWIESKYLISS